MTTPSRHLFRVGTSHQQAFLFGSVALIEPTAAVQYTAAFEEMSEPAMLDIKGMRFPISVILVCIRWYAAYPLSYRHLEEMMQERSVAVDHSTINRWAIRFLHLLEKAFRNHKHAVDTSWRMDETYIMVNGL